MAPPARPGPPAGKVPTLSECACFNARNAARAITDLYDEVLAPSGLRTNQFAILVAIHQRRGASMQAIAAALGLDPSTMTRVLRPLEEAGLVATAPAESRRAKQLTLTQRGRAKLRATRSLWRQAQDRLRGTLGADIFERLVGDLTTVREALRP